MREFQYRLFDNIFFLHTELKNKTYQHGGYQTFSISDPKPRSIHKASVRDRLLHHAIYRILYPFFDRTFIADSYSCRYGKGTHRAMNRFRDFTRKVSRNDTKTIWVLKCDIKKFFASIDQHILLEILRTHIPDKDIIYLIEKIVGSFYITIKGKGLPLGNLTSQLLVNIYMNELDQFVKHELKAKYYIRYADDFIVLSRNKRWLENVLWGIKNFLFVKLQLKLHPDKVSIKTLASGVDFLGWIHFPDHRVLRATTKRRMIKAIVNNPKRETVASYAGMLKHGNAYKLSRYVQNRS